MSTTARKNYLIALRAVHTRLLTLKSQARTNGIPEEDAEACTADLSQALKSLERVLSRIETTDGKRKA
jgi:hypothetical protein